MAKTILVRPIITEKSEQQTEDENKYSFVVDIKANKIEVRKAIEERYDVEVTSINTMIIPGKNKSRYTRAGMISGRKPAYKKAVVSVEDGDFIDLYGDI